MCSVPTYPQKVKVNNMKKESLIIIRHGIFKKKCLMLCKIQQPTSHFSEAQI